METISFSGGDQRPPSETERRTRAHWIQEFLSISTSFFPQPSVRRETVERASEAAIQANSLSSTGRIRPSRRSVPSRMRARGYLRLELTCEGPCGGTTRAKIRKSSSCLADSQNRFQRLGAGVAARVAGFSDVFTAWLSPGRWDAVAAGPSCREGRSLPSDQPTSFASVPRFPGFASFPASPAVRVGAGAREGRERARCGLPPASQATCIVPSCLFCHPWLACSSTSRVVANGSLARSPARSLTRSLVHSSTCRQVATAI